MTSRDIIQHQKDMEEFRKTRAEAAMSNFERLLGNAWVIDQRETSSDKSMREAWAKSDAAKQELIAAIKELQD
jgi:hypothetical protein